jgi:hypothetical protein
VKNAEKDSDKQEKHYHLLQKHQGFDLFVLIKCKKNKAIIIIELL